MASVHEANSIKDGVKVVIDLILWVITKNERGLKQCESDGDAHSNAGLTMDDFRKMTPRQALEAGIGKGVDWREIDRGDVHIPSHPDVPDVTVGFHKNLPAEPPEDEDEEVMIARAEREKAAQDSVIQDLARRLGVPGALRCRLFLFGIARVRHHLGHETHCIQAERFLNVFEGRDIVRVWFIRHG